MAQIQIVDLEVLYNVGVTDEERAKPQRLLLCVELSVDVSAAAASDRLAHTIDYFMVCQELLDYGNGRSWRLIEKTAMNLADFIMVRFKPRGVKVEVKKFVIPQAKYVSVTLSKP